MYSEVLNGDGRQTDSCSPRKEITTAPRKNNLKTPAKQKKKPGRPPGKTEEKNVQNEEEKKERKCNSGESRNKKFARRLDLPQCK